MRLFLRTRRSPAVPILRHLLRLEDARIHSNRSLKGGCSHVTGLSESQSRNSHQAPGFQRQQMRSSGPRKPACSIHHVYVFMVSSWLCSQDWLIVTPTSAAKSDARRTVVRRCCCSLASARAVQQYQSPTPRSAQRFGPARASAGRAPYRACQALSTTVRVDSRLSTENA